MNQTINNNEFSKPKVSQKVVKLANEATGKDSEFDKDIAILHKPFINGFGMGITYAAIHDRMLKNPDGGHALLIPNAACIYLTIANTDIIHWNAAHLPGGVELKISHIDTESIPKSSDFIEHLSIAIPDSLLNVSASEGLRIRISRPDKGAEHTINIDPINFLAVLYLRNQDGYEIDNGNSKNSSNRNQISDNLSEKNILTDPKWLLVVKLLTLSFITLFLGVGVLATLPQKEFIGAFIFAFFLYFSFKQTKKYWIVLKTLN